MALAILAVALVGLIGRTSRNIRLTQEMGMVGTVTELTRGKMYDIEAMLLHDGFQELDQSTEGDFADEGWPAISWEAKVEKVELPGLGALGAMEEGAEGEDGASTSPLGGIMGSMGGFGGVSAADMPEASFIASQFELVSQVLEVSIRKVTVTVTWRVGNEDKEMVVSCYFTDPAAMNKVIGGLAGGGGGVGGAGGSGPSGTFGQRNPPELE